MAAGELINAIQGNNGKKLVVGEVTLSSGTGTVTTPLTSVEYCFITQKDATAVAEGWSWSVSSGTITVDSSNASSAETLSVLAVGY